MTTTNRPMLTNIVGRITDTKVLKERNTVLAFLIKTPLNWLEKEYVHCTSGSTNSLYFLSSFLLSASSSISGLMFNCSKPSEVLSSSSPILTKASSKLLV